MIEIFLMATYFLLAVKKSLTEVKHKQKDQNGSLASLFFFFKRREKFTAINTLSCSTLMKLHQFKDTLSNKNCMLVDTYLLLKVASCYPQKNLKNLYDTYLEVSWSFKKAL